MRALPTVLHPFRMNNFEGAYETLDYRLCGALFFLFPALAFVLIF